MRIDTRPDGSAALGKSAQARQTLGQPPMRLSDLAGPTGDFLPEPNRHRIHQMRAACLDDVVCFLGLCFQGFPQVDESRQQILDQDQRRTDMNRRRNDVVTALPHIHVVIRVYWPGAVLAGQSGNDFVGIHVGACA